MWINWYPKRWIRKESTIKKVISIISKTNNYCLIKNDTTLILINIKLSLVINCKQKNDNNNKDKNFKERQGNRSKRIIRDLKITKN